MIVLTGRYDDDGTSTPLGRIDESTKVFDFSDVAKVSYDRVIRRKNIVRTTDL